MCFRLYFFCVSVLQSIQSVLKIQFKIFSFVGNNRDVFWKPKALVQDTHRDSICEIHGLDGNLQINISYCVSHPFNNIGELRILLPVVNVCNSEWTKFRKLTSVLQNCYFLFLVSKKRSRKQKQRKFSLYFKWIHVFRCMSSKLIPLSFGQSLSTEFYQICKNRTKGTNCWCEFVRILW